MPLKSRGCITGTVADARIILGVALKITAYSIILSHNHPSGSLKPSKADIQITEQIAAATKFMKLKVVDHIIVSPDREFLSFANEGLMN